MIRRSRLRGTLITAAVTAALASNTTTEVRADVTFLNSFGGPSTATSGTLPGQFVYVYDLAVAPNGNVYATDQVAQPSYVSVFSPTGSYITRFRASTGTLNSGYLAGVAIDSQGVGYVGGNSSPYQLYTLSTTTNTITGVTNSGNGTTQFQSPAAVATGPSNDVYVLDGFKRDIQVYDANGTYKLTIGTAGYGDGQFIGPNSVSVGPSGQVYVDDVSLNRVEVFNADGSFRTTIGSAGSGDGQFNAPYFVEASAGTGRVYVSDLRNKRVQVFTADGTFLSSFGAAGGAGQILSPGGIAVAPDGMIYIADADPSRARIDRFFDPAEWISGTNAFTDPSAGPVSAGVGSGEILGTSFTLGASKGLILGGDMNVRAGGSLTVAGGTLAASNFNITGASANALVTGGDNVTVTNVNVTAGGRYAMSNHAAITLAGGGFTLGDAGSTAALQQLSTLRAHAVSIDSGGSIGISGNSLLGSANDLNNHGTIWLSGSEITADGAIANIGTILGDGAITAGAGGIANEGTIGLAGNSHVTGNLVNQSGGTIRLAGVTPNVFLNDVTNDGTITIDAGSGATFYGTFSGSQGISGAGTAFFDGPVSPGAGAAAAPTAASVHFDGNVVLASNSSIVEDLAGHTAGTQYDAIDVSGNSKLDGALVVRAIGGFVPLPGDRFDILHFGSHTGDFASIDNETDRPGLRFTKTYTSTGLTLTATGLPGDADLSGNVDLTDFTFLAANFNATGKTWLDGDFSGDGRVDLTDFTFLASNFNKALPPDGAAVSLGSSVPEPATTIFVIPALLGLLVRGRRRR